MIGWLRRIFTPTPSPALLDLTNSGFPENRFAPASTPRFPKIEEREVVVIPETERGHGGFSPADISWSEVIDPPALYRIEYADRHGEYSERMVYLARKGTGPNGNPYVGAYENGKFKTLRADRILSMQEIDIAGTTPQYFGPTEKIKTITISPEEIEFLGALVRARGPAYFAEHGTAWSRKLGGPWEDAVGRLAIAGLLVAGTTQRTSFAVTAKGAAIAAEHCADAEVRAMAKRKAKACRM